MNFNLVWFLLTVSFRAPRMSLCRAANLIISKRWSFYIFSVHGGGDGGEDARRASGGTSLLFFTLRGGIVEFTQPLANTLQ